MKKLFSVLIVAGFAAGCEEVPTPPVKMPSANVDAIKDAAKDGVDKVKEAGADAAGKVKDAAGDAVDKVKDAAGDAVDKVKEGAGAALDKAKEEVGKDAPPPASPSEAGSTTK